VHYIQNTNVVHKGHGYNILVVVG